MNEPWLTVVTTPRRPEYLSATITNIEAAGAASWKGPKFLFVDGDADQLPWRPPASWKVIGRGKNFAGNAANSVHVFKEAANADIPFILFFEDDLAFVQNAITVMGKVEIPSDCWALQFCDLRAFGDPRSDQIRIFRQRIQNHINRDCNPAEACTMWGDQALKVPQHMLKQIAKSSLPKGWESQQGVHHADVLFSLISMEQSAAPYLGIVAPSLVQHVGLRSLCNEGRNLTDLGRSARNFPGLTFDAFSLLK